MIKVVLDSNVIVSSLLFKGRTAQLHSLWKLGRITLLANAEMIREYAAVLAYPKFGLEEEDIRLLLEEELLSYIVPVKPGSKALSHPPEDHSDIPFLKAALAGKVQVLVSGDGHLLKLKGFYSFKILSPGEFLNEYFPRK
jgi:putative PIN family toxin of toxin-antitoxin system